MSLTYTRAVGYYPPTVDGDHRQWGNGVYDPTSRKCSIPGSLAAAIADIGAIDALVPLYPGNTFTLTANLTIPANVTLDFLMGVIETNGYTLTINSDCQSVDWQAFDVSGGGAVVGLKRATPRMFGAVGDNTTDDSAAVAAACGLTNCHVQFRGKFKTTAQVSLVSSLTLTMVENSWVNAQVPTAAAFYGSALSDVRAEGFRLIGSMGRGFDFRTCTDVSLSRIRASGVTNATAPASAAIYMSACTDCDLDDIRAFENGLAVVNDTDALADVLLDDCEDCNLKDIRCRSAVAINFGLQNCRWITVHGLWCANAVTSANNQLWGYGLMLYGYGVGGVCEFIVMTDVHVTNTGGSGVYLQTACRNTMAEVHLYDVVKTMTGGSLAQGAIACNSLSTDNIIGGIQIDTSGKAGIRNDGARNQFSGGRIANTTLQAIQWVVAPHDSKYSGFTVSACAGGAGGTGSLNIRGLTFAHMTIEDTTGTNGGIEIDSISVLNLIDVIVRRAATNGFTLSNASRVNADGSFAIDCNQVASTYDGWRLSNVTFSHFTECHGFNDAGTTQTYGMRFTGTSDFNWIIDCDLHGNATGPWVLTGTNNVTRGNRFTATGAIQGRATLVGGTVTVSNVEITGSDDVIITRQTPGGTLGNLSRGTLVAGTSFVIDSDSATDTSLVAWEIVHRA